MDSNPKSRIGKSIIDRLLVPTAVSLTTVVFALLILQRLLLQQQAEVQSSTRAQAQLVKDEMESDLSATILPLELLRERWGASTQLDFPHMESDTGLAMSGYPGYQAIEWVDPSLHTRWAVPSAGNEADLGMDESSDPRRLEALMAAEQSGRMMATRSVELRQGGRGVLVCVPLFRNGRLNGFLVGVFRLQDLLGSMLRDVGPNYWLAVSDGDEEIYRREGATPPRKEAPVQGVPIQFQQLTWQTQVWPAPEKAGNAESILPQVTFVGGLVLAAWLAVTAYMAEAARMRAKELATTNKELQKEIAGREQAEEALREAQKMEAVGRLAGGVAHDFNNMLMVIRSQAELSLNGLASGDPLRAELDEIVRTSNRASSLTRQLLAFGRKQMLKPQMLDINTLVAQVAALLPPVLGVDIKLNLDLEDELGLVKADASHLEQVMMNLVFNARDAMPTGGELTIHTENTDLDDAWVASHNGAQAGPHVMLAVSDTGCGMNQETLSHIFEPFFTTKDRGKGTGLGLASVYGTVHQSGGSITISSKVGAGTSVRIYLPRVEGVVETVEAPQEKPASLQGLETILVVEDDDAVRRMTRELLLIKGYQVVEARSAVEAIDFMERHSDTIDLVLTDLSMPGMKGQELGERLGKVHTDVRLLYMSAYTEDAVQTNGTLSAGAAFIEKPFGAEELARKVREVLGSKNGHARARSASN
jgi:signal transduction histidine kinase/ActR/RegA family two-component response regulator